MNKKLAIKIENVKKQYRLGTIGGGTLRGDLQSWWARIRGKEDPNLKIGQVAYTGNERFYALNGINFEVYEGERLGIIGGNGAGKSTTLKLLSRVTAPTEGNIYINGRISSMLEVGTGFHPELTGRENIYLNGAILGMSKAEVDRKIEDIIDFSECRQFIDTPVKRYSSGMYVKLAFAVAAHLDSEILIMDEVLAVGDMKFQQKCLDKMTQVSKDEGRTVLYVSHNMNTIRQLCNRCIVLDKGHVIFDGDVEEAINVYSGAQGKVKKYYEFTKNERTNRSSKNEFVFKSLEILNSKENFNCGDLINLNLKCYSAEEWNEVKFRFEIHHQDGSIVGTKLSENKIHFNKNELKSLYLDFDTYHLTPGRYKVFIVAYVYDKFGNECFLDGVYPGFVFNLSEDLNEFNELIWLSRYWGHVHLHNVKIKEKIN